MRERHTFPEWWTPMMVVSRVNDKHGHASVMEALDEALRRGV
jgi:hypothetical protein